MTENNSKEFVTSRIVDAPRDLVWKAFSESQRLAEWWGPTGMTWVKCELDFRPGGLFHYCMKSPDGHEMWGKFVYKEIVPMEKIVFINSFSDEKGGITRHPMNPKWPAEVHNTLTFEEKDGKTTLTLRGGPINCTGEERKIFEDGFSSMEKGFRGTFDQLDAYLEKTAKEIVISRIINAPREKVWKAWSDPARIMKWWGPNGFTNTFDEFNFKKGGSWKFTMHGPDGTDYPSIIVFDEMVEPERIAYHHSGLDSPELNLKGFRSVVTFEETGGKTMVTLTNVFASKEECERQKKEVRAEEGGRQTLGRLAADVEQLIMSKIHPFLWFNDQAEEAANFYISLFKNSKILSTTRYQGGKELEEISGRKQGTVMTVEFELCGAHFSALNGGPIFTFNPSVSFTVECETEQDVDKIWAELSNGGKVLMELKEYPFSKKYGWLQDKFGVSWQIILTGTPQKIMPFLMFTGAQFGKAEEAMKLYCSLFKDSKINDMFRAGPGEPEKEGTISHATFQLNGQPFMAMESSIEHKFTFNEAISFVVSCENQEEVDYFWDKLSEGGDPKAQQCGWLKDKYGVSWQIVPTAMGKLMSGPNAQKVTSAMLKMKKLDIKGLEEAAAS